MSLEVKLKNTALLPVVEYDITDYYLSGNPILYERNRNFEPVISTLNFELSGKITDTVPLTAFQKDSTIRFIVDSFVSTFRIQKREFDYKNRRWKVQAVSPLILLQDIKVDSVQLDALIHSTLDPYKVNVQDNRSDPSWLGSIGLGTYYHSIQILWLLECMFQACYLTLDTSEVSELTMISGGFPYYFKDLCIDEYMLYMVNQNFAYDYSLVGNYHEDFFRQKISIWNFVRTICSFCGFIIYQTGDTTYSLKHPSGLTGVSVPDAQKYGYSTTDLESDDPEITFNYRYTPTSYYYQHSEFKDLDYPQEYVPNLNLDPVAVQHMIFLKKPTDRKTQDIAWFNNLLFWLRDNTQSNGDLRANEYGLGMKPTDYYDMISPYLVWEYTKDWTIENIETSIITTAYGDVRKNELILDQKHRRSSLTVENYT